MSVSVWFHTLKQKKTAKCIKCKYKAIILESHVTKFGHLGIVKNLVKMFNSLFYTRLYEHKTDKEISADVQ
jgi:uncharacterized membrane protein